MFKVNNSLILKDLDIKKTGSFLLSHGQAAVPSTLERFTSVFGKGTGISTLLWPPGDHMVHRVDGPMIRSEPKR